MKKNLITSLVALFAITLFFASCDKDDANGTVFDGLSVQVQDVVPDTILNDIINFGMPINRGTTPPNLENSYLGSLFVLDTSNVFGDWAGRVFADYRFKLYEQNNAAMTIRLDYVNGPESGSGLGGFISGSGNSFTVFVEVNSTYNNTNADLVHIISGTLTDGGINDLYFANFMINNYGNPGGIWIDEGEGRIIYDQDGFSEEIASIELKAVPKRRISVSRK